MHTTPLHRLPFLWLALAGMAVAAPDVAWGQNSLGDGRGLQKSNRSDGRALQRDTKRDTSRYGAGSAAPRDPLAAARLQEAIITGSAPGGMSFRGRVGSTNPNEFRGRLGGDEVYRFRRDSFYSGLAGEGIRGTEALQYQFALSTGGAQSGRLADSFSVGRDSRASSGGNLGTQPPGGPRGVTSFAPTRVDSSPANTLRSTSTFTTTRTLSPSLVRQRRVSSTEAELATASTLLGYSRARVVIPSEPSPATRSASPISAAAGSPTGADRAGEFVSPDGRSTIVQNTTSAAPGSAAGASASTTSAVTQAQIRSAFAEVAQRVQETELAPREGRSGFLNSLEDLRARLTGDRTSSARGRATAPAPASNTPDTAAATPPPVLRDERGRPLVLGDPEFLNALRQAGGSVREYVVASAPADEYVSNLRQGERLLSLERYFDAEESFSRAARSKPGDPVAQIGRAHAQIGAGLIGPAERNLKDLLRTNPEIIATRYAGSMLPFGSRLQVVAEDLARTLDRVDGSTNSGEFFALRSEAGFLLAYLGYQMNNEAMLRRGLDAYTRAAAESNNEIEQDLATLLRGVWVISPTPDVTPTPTPAPAPTPGQGEAVTPTVEPTK